jgi:15-cis-phytoene synthase
LELTEWPADAAYHRRVDALAQSLAECRRITAGSRSSFRFAFGVLPREQRQAMDALYAFFRLTDDLGDDESLGDPEIRRRLLADWRSGFAEAMAGRFTHPIHEALNWAVTTFAVPPRYLLEVIDGCESDLLPQAVANEDELLHYCYRVASAVGLACIRVWGLQPGVMWDKAEPLAIQAGYAFQLTNILRDLGEDAARGRVYLPADDLQRFGVEPATWGEAANRGRFEAMLAYQIERARGYYRSSATLGEMLAPRGRAIHGLMSRAYAGLLNRIEAAGAGVLTQRVRLGKWEKAKLMGRVLKAKMGFC